MHIVHFVSYAHVNLSHFFSSSWCQGLAATSACGSSWTFLFTFLPKELGSKGFVMTVEDTYVRRCSNKTNKLRYAHSTLGTPKDITIEEQKINYIEIKIVSCIINFSGNCTIR